MAGADVAGDVAWMKKCIAMWQHVGVHVFVCARVKREIKLIFHAHVMWRHKERLIRAINEDRRSSLMLGGMRCNLIHRRIIFKKN